jgi:hypothetical protein
MESKDLMNLENLPEDIKKEIMADGAKYSSTKTPVAPTIGISTDDETIGQFYVDYGENDGGVKFYGKEMHVVVMKERKTFSYYNDKSKKLELFSNEMDVVGGKVPYHHPVVIKDNNGEAVFSGTYEQFMEAKKEHWVDHSNQSDKYIKSLLKQKTLLYVWLPEEKKIVRLFVNLSSSVGVDPAGGYMFSDPTPGSLEDLRKKKSGAAPYTYVVRLTNVKGGGEIAWRQIKFDYLVDVPADKIVDMFKIKREVEEYCDLMNEMFGVKKVMTVENSQKTLPSQAKSINGPEGELPTIQVDEDIDFNQSDNQPPLESGSPEDNEPFDVSKIPF